MRKIRLTEQGLIKLVKKIIREQEDMNEFFDEPKHKNPETQYDKATEQELKKFLMIAVSNLGKKRTSKLLKSVIIKLDTPYGPSSIHSSMDDYRDIDFTDIMGEI